VLFLYLLCMCRSSFLSFLFFFSSRRRHTRSKRDWSSDVCSSDLRIKLCKKCAMIFLLIFNGCRSTILSIIRLVKLSHALQTIRKLSEICMNGFYLLSSQARSIWVGFLLPCSFLMCV